MARTFFTVGTTTTESMDSHQPVWVLLPETKVPAVVSTYARQIYPSTKVLVRLGNVQNLFNHHFLPRINATENLSLKSRQPQLATASAEIDAFAGDVHKRAQIFLSYLSAKWLIDPRLYPIIERIAQKTPLTRRHIKPLMDALYVALRNTVAVTLAQKRKIRDLIETGNYDTATILWLALFVDPRFALHLWHDDLIAHAQTATEQAPSPDRAALERDLRGAIEQIQTRGDCPKEIGGVNFRNWFTSLIGCAPQQRFFVEVGECHEGLNKAGCLKLDLSRSFQDFSETAPRFISLDKLSRAVTAFDRTLSHLVIRFGLDDDEMKQLSENYPLHSGMLVRGLLGESETMRTLYPWNLTTIPNQPALSERLIERTREAVADGSLAQVCARHYVIPAAQLQRGIECLLTILRKTLPLLPMEVHHLANAIESRLRLRKAAQALQSGGRAAHRQRAVQLDVSARTQTARQFAFAKTLKADFHIDPTKIFYIDNLLIDRIKAIYGNDLEFMRRILAGYIERHNAAHQSTSAAAGSKVNS